MKKENIEKYVDLALFALGVVIFGGIMFVVFHFGKAMFEAIF